MTHLTSCQYYGWIFISRTQISVFSSECSYFQGWKPETASWKKQQKPVWSNYLRVHCSVCVNGQHHWYLIFNKSTVAADWHIVSNPVSDFYWYSGRTEEVWCCIYNSTTVITGSEASSLSSQLSVWLSNDTASLIYLLQSLWPMGAYTHTHAHTHTHTHTQRHKSNKHQHCPKANYKHFLWEL